MVKPFILSGVDSKAACDLDAAYNCLAQEEMSVSRKLVANPYSVWPIVLIQCMTCTLHRTHAVYVLQWQQAHTIKCMSHSVHPAEPRHQVAGVWHLSGW